MVFPAVYVGCENWSVKKAEHWRIGAIELTCWRRLLKVPWTARRSNQSILKEIIPEYSLEDWCWNWSSKTLTTWCEGLTHLKRSWCWERLKAGGEWDNRGWDGWMASPTWWTWVWASSGSWWWTVKPGMLQSMVSHRVGRDWVTGLNWTVMMSCSVVLWDPLWRGPHSENQGRPFSQQLSRKKDLSPSSKKIWIISTIQGVSFKNNPSSWAWK